MALHLPDEVKRELMGWAGAAYPYEACGLLIGRQQNGACHVQRACQARNLSRSREQFQLDPHDYLAAEQDAARNGLDIVGVWHTHPDHSAQPSITDLAAAWGGWSYLILSVGTTGGIDLRSWRLAQQGFIEEVIADE